MDCGANHAKFAAGTKIGPQLGSASARHARGTDLHWPDGTASSQRAGHAADTA